MSKVIRQNNKLKGAIIISAILHALLVFLLIWSSFNENIDNRAGGGGIDINAVMVDPAAVVEQYQQQKINQSIDQQRDNQVQLRAEAQKAEEAAQKAAAEAKQKAEEVAQKAAAEAKQKAEEAAQKAAAEAKQKAEEVAQKAAAEAKQKAEEVAQKAAAEAKQKAEEAAQKAAAEAKAKIAQQAKEKAAAEVKRKAAAQAAKESSEVDDLLGGLTSESRRPKERKTSSAPAGQDKQKTVGASESVLKNYANQVKTAIQGKFYNWESFKGKECILQIKLAPDGLLIDAQPEKGDTALCQAALAAAKQARIPKPPSQAVYEIYKNVPLDFKPGL